MLPMREEGKLSNFREDWDRLTKLAAESNVFMTFEWYMAWLHASPQEHFPGEVKPWLLLRRQGQTIEAITPLVERVSARFGFAVRKIQFVTPHADYNDLCVGSNPLDHADALLQLLRSDPRSWDIVEFSNLRACDTTFESLQRSLRRSGLPFTLRPEPEGCPYLAINGDTASLIEKRFSGDARRKLRRRMQNAQTAGLRVRIIEQPQREPGLLRKLIELEAKKMLRSSFPPLLGTYPAIFHQLFETLGPRDCLYVALLETGEQPVAFQLGFRCGDKLWDYTKAFDNSFSRFAPGTLLVAALLDYGFAHGYREYDFLRGEEEYKSVWTQSCHRTYRLIIWNQRWGSRLRKFLYYDCKAALFRLLGRPSCF